MSDNWNRFRQMEDQRRRDVQAKFNQINFDRSMRAAQRGDERRRAEKAFKESAATEAVQPVLTEHDFEIMDRTMRIAIYGGLLAGAATICAMIVHLYPTIVPLGYGIIAGLGLLAGWMTFKFLASEVVQDILGFAVMLPKTAIVITTVGGLIVFLIWRHAG